ncbi:putative Lipase, class 3 [Melampsora larici-populina 98AG31]|uniref:Putative Lipase, class 3 n=1 Tax=Melampsora larici-populina (strain 98AG31 / pathotype 3-4-7) TaxID=747676 RepID=F4RBR3_MELLP|nr:putative Lipase, class 3 [Melampsora larici-populina 98AG31]EGG10148.1 putative Lipase, class 3 [Melampsora larici-populina 98AG31]
MRTLPVSLSSSISKRHRMRLPRKDCPYLYHDSEEWKNLVEGREEEVEKYYIRIYDHLSPLQRTILTQHAADVKSYSDDRKSIVSKIKATQTYRLVSSSFKMLFRSFLMICGNPLSFFTRPFNTMYMILYFGVIYSALFVLNIVFLAAHVLGVGKVLSYLGGKYGGGWTIINWVDINLFDSKKHIFDNALPALGSDLDEHLLTVEEHPEIVKALSSKSLEFNVDIARAILLMCSIVYERDTDFVQKAAHASSSNTQPDESVLFLIKGEERMLQLADEWGISFVSVADFQKLSGPFAACFYSYENIGQYDNPYIVLVMKGTSPTDFTEWIQDCECKLESAGDFLATGMAHEGFYDSLFPPKSFCHQVLPYFRMIEMVKTIAAEAFKHTGKKCNLFVGGHSLGAGIASLLYARLLETPEDLGDQIVLRDAYTFGTPRTCDARLASRVDYNLNKPINRGRQMWRVCNRSRSPIIGDCVTRVPPGIASNRGVRGAVKDGSYFSYSTIGIQVDLKPFQLAPFYSIMEIPAGHCVNVCKLRDEPEIEFARNQEMSQIGFPQDIVQISMELVGLFLPFLHDHFPASYMDALNRMQAMIGSQSNINKQEESKQQESKLNGSTHMLRDAVQNNRLA